MKNKKLLFFLFPPIVLAVASAIVMWLWNALLPQILGVKAVSFWQAMGILILSKILFGGFHGRCGRFGNFAGKFGRNGAQQMTPEEKERLKEIWNRRCRGRFSHNEK